MAKKNDEEVSSRVIIGKGEKIFLIINNCIMALLVVITLYPMLYVVFVSVSDPIEFGKTTGLLLKPAGFSLEAYADVFKAKNLWLGFRNTLFYCFAGGLLSLVVTTLAAFAMAQKEFMLKKSVMIYILITMYFGGGMIPSYLLMKDLGLLNTVWAVVIPGAFGAYNMIVMRTQFQSIPESLYDSAYLDGANEFQILAKIALPLSKPTLATITLFLVVGRWGEWYSALVYLQKRRDLFPLQMFLREALLSELNVETLLAEQLQVEVDYFLKQEIAKYAMIVVSTLPILLVYPFLQKYFVKGVLVGSIKG